MVFSKAVIFAACAFICASQPVEKLPVLKATPSEVLFRVEAHAKPLFLQCVTTHNIDGITYKWHKNGKEFTADHPDVMQLEDEGSLVFARPKAEDEGEYKCLAESDQGTASTGIINVRRAYIDEPDVKTHKHKPVEGRPFKLECDIPDSYPQPEIYWELQLETDPSVSSEVADARYTVSPEGDLYISSVNKDDVQDNFKYVCLAKSPAVDKGVPLVEHYIEGLEKDSQKPDNDVVKQYVSEDQTAMYGESLFLYCIFGGEPLAHPDWYKDGRNVNGDPTDRVTRYNRSKGKRLLIRAVQLQDAGQYACVADNDVGQPLNHTMRLTVVRAPEYEVEPEDFVQVKEGQDLTIPCKVAAVPHAKVTWTYNAKPLQSNDRIAFNPVNSSGTTVADLTIKKVQKSDKGYYGCHAENEHGEIYSEILVYF